MIEMVGVMARWRDEVRNIQDQGMQIIEIIMTAYFWPSYHPVIHCHLGAIAATMKWGGGGGGRTR